MTVHFQDKRLKIVRLHLAHHILQVTLLILKIKITVVHSTQEQDSRLQNLFHKVQNYSMTHPRRDGEFMTVLHQEQQ